jgi:gliding motility-associated-like protein
MQLCPETDDVTGYRLYYSQLEGGAFTQIGEINEAGVLTFDHQPPDGIAGCYAVTAIDTFFNESAFSNVVCVDNCPLYRLPNAFTPNGDNQNDLFVPTVSCFVASVDFQIFNRWGQLVFSTQDPQLNWNGANLNGEALEQSTYYYRCQVFEQRVGGIVPSPELLSGYIELLRGPQ